jgi:hypothetical protein
MKSTKASLSPAAGFVVRSGVRAGGYYGCQAYCNQEYRRCQTDPNLVESVCNDRLPVCQNACDVCALTP